MTIFVILRKISLLQFLLKSYFYCKNRKDMSGHDEFRGSNKVILYFTGEIGHKIKITYRHKQRHLEDT